MSRTDDKAATQVLVKALSDSIEEHDTTKKELRACVLTPTPGCGVPSNVVLSHHNALVTLVNGQTLLLQSRQADLTVRSNQPERQMDDLAALPENGISWQKGKGIRARGTAGVLIAIAAVLSVIVAGMHWFAK